ncbi:MAG: thioredoxin family protein [Erysipelotrichaceae bacterium]|nr:thioredoxin family protein [Erysipelotrichaceae bacterium]
MRKLLLLFSLLLICTGCAAATPESSENLGRIIELTPQEIIDKADSGETFFLYVTLSTCPVCAEYKNVTAEFIKNYDVTIYHIEIDSYTDEETAVLSSDYLDNLTDAPDSFVFVNGELKYEKVGMILYRNLKSILKEYGFVN